MANFVELLKNIYSPNPELREHSITTYKTMAKEQPNELIMLLIEVMANNDDVKVRCIDMSFIRFQCHFLLGSALKSGFALFRIFKFHSRFSSLKSVASEIKSSSVMPH